MTDLKEQNLIRELVDGDDDILYEETPKFDFAEPPIDPIELAHILAQSVIEHNGLGLAAPQLGLPYRAFIMKASPMICMFNPKIVGESEDFNYLDEGCLSFPNLIIKIKRADVIRVRYTQPNGDINTKRFEGMTSRIIQHEIDHLDGIVFHDRANPMHMEQAKKRLRKMSKK